MRRCLAGSALTAAILAGCGGHRPFADGFDATPAAALTAAPGADAPAPAAAPPVLGEDATLDDYLRYAARRNPGLEARFQEWKAAVERVPQVGALPDPRLTYGYYLGEIETRVGPMRHMLSLAQTFPWFGKIRDREDAAARQANAAYQRFEDARLELFLRVERAYNELYFLKQSIDVTDENIALLQQFERVARTRYRVAAAGHPALIRIQVELGTYEDRRRRLDALRAPYTARLNAALDRPADAEVPWPTAVSDRVADVPEALLLAALRARNPELRALAEEVERERVATDLARRDGQPDLTVGLAYTAVGERNDVALAENGDDAVLATLSINLPIWREKYDAGVREAVARRLAAASRRGDTMNQLAADLQEALFEHNDARRRVDLYRTTLIPKAEESLQASLASFAQGESDFLDLIDTQRTLLEFQLGLERALVDRATSRARIERLVGADLADLAANEEETP